MSTRFKQLQPFAYRADVERQDEDDEEAEVPRQQRPQEDHALLPAQIPIALQEVEGQEENHHHHHSQRGTTHTDGRGDRRQGFIAATHWRRGKRHTQTSRLGISSHMVDNWERRCDLNKGYL